MSTSDNKDKKAKKPKGPIRYEAVIPVLVISLATFVYFSFYFDHHMKKLVEYVGTQANGAEVNVDSIRTSFLRGTFDLDRLQITDKERPERNVLEIGSMHFGYLWDALLRMKFVVEDASITNIQLYKPRTSPGKVLPPEPAKPSKMTELQNEVIGQIKDKYSANMLGDAMALLEGGDYQEQIKEIRGTLKSENRVNEMISDVQKKKDSWDNRIKELSDPKTLKAVEAEIQAVSKQKDFLKQAQSIQKLTDLLKDVDKQYKEIKSSSKELESEIKAVTEYPNELQGLINQDIASLKNRFSVPKLDFQDMAMHLFAGQFAKYIADARKYQALAKQYIPEKKEEEEAVIPKKRSEGKNYEFPVKTGYPLFWLKRAAISSVGTADSYTGKVSGELANVTTSPKLIAKPITLDVRGDFPGVQVMGVKALLTADFTQEISKQSAHIQVNSFAVPEKLFVNDEKMKFGFKNAIGTSTLVATLREEQIKMSWNSALSKPNFLVETQNKIAKEMLGNILNNIPLITIDGDVSGSFSKFDMKISSNLGEELSQGFSRELTAKVNEAQAKINQLVEEKINRPKSELTALLGGNKQNLAELGKLESLYKKNEDKIKMEIEKLKKGGTNKAVDDLKQKGKKLFKGIKF